MIWIWEAYHELQTDRPMSMSLGPIPWSAIDQWARSEGLADRKRFERLIRALDTVFLEHHNRQHEE